MRSFVWAGVLVLLAGGGGLSAQRPHRSGLWGELAPGVGYVRLACAGCPDVETASGVTSHFRIGGTVSQHVVMGVEAFSMIDRPFGTTTEDSTSAESGTFAVIVMWFPGKSGLFFKGGVGTSYGEFVIAADTSRGNGLGLTFGMGWDFPISRKFAITGNLATYVTGMGDIVLPGRRVEDVIATMYELSVGFTFR
jgi:hypothetical protein